MLGAAATFALIALQVTSLVATLERLDQDEETRIRAALVRVRERIDPGDVLARQLRNVLTPEGFSEAGFQLVLAALREKLAEEYERQGLAPNQDVRLWYSGATDPRIPSDGGPTTHQIDLSRSIIREGYFVGIVHPGRSGLSRLTELPVLGSLSLGLTLTIFLLCAAALRLSRGIEERSERQRVFVENFTHELRTPVFALSVAVKTLAKDPHFNAEDQPLITRVENATRRVRTHVERLAQLMALEHAKPRPASRVDLHALLGSVVPVYRTRAEEANGELILNSEAHHPIVRGDADAWRSVLENLLDNALRYSGSVCAIRVSTRTHDADLELLVEDRGPGVPPAQRSLIFERYQRVSEGTVHNTKGLGLGLAIAREVVRAAGGSIGCEPREEGGARFRVRVPHVLPDEDARNA
jgi:signal transduction histidine kinase